MKAALGLLLLVTWLAAEDGSDSSLSPTLTRGGEGPPMPGYFGPLKPLAELPPIDPDWLPTPAQATFVVTGPAREVAPNLPALEPGDLIVGIDGRQISNVVDLDLLIRTRVNANAPLTITVRRGEALVEVPFTDPLPNLRIRPESRQSATRFCGYPVSRPPHPVTERLVAAGLEFSDNDRSVVSVIPRRLAWSLPAGERAPAWLVPLVMNYLALVNDRPGDVEPVTVPAELTEWAWFAAVLEAAAADYAADQWQAVPALAAAGVPTWFTALALPVPSRVPELGDGAGISEIYPGFASQLLAAMSNQIDRSVIPLRPQHGQETTSSAYVDLVALALVDPEQHGGWPFRYHAISDRRFRRDFLNRLPAVRAEYPAWSQICDLAEMIVRAIEGQQDQAVALARGLNAASPVLGYQARSMLLYTVDFHNLRWKTRDIHRALPVTDMKPEPRHNVLIEQLRARSLNHATWMNDHEGWAPMTGNHLMVSLFRLPVYEALQPNAEALASLAYDFKVVRRELNHLAFRTGFSDSVNDPDDVERLVALLGWRYREEGPPYYRLAVAAQLSWIGAFDRAAAWNRGNAREYENRAHRPDPRDHMYRITMQQLGAIQARTTFALPEGGQPQPHERTNDAGELVARGHVIGNKRWGPWRWLYPDGSVKSVGWYHDNAQIGYWMSYDEAGNLTKEGRKIGGNPVGPWREWSPEGWVSAQGWFIGKGGNGRSGWWEYYHPDGAVAEAGLYRKGKRTGVWHQYDPSGEVLATGHYHNDRREGAWQERPDATQPLAPVRYQGGELVAPSAPEPDLPDGADGF